jgi:uncharacterized membrane protein
MKNSNSIMESISGGEQNVGNTERIASAVTGGALVALGLKQRGFFGTVLSVLGGGLLLRGATGHCHVYDAAGIDTAENTTSRTWNKKGPAGKVHVTKSLTINKSPAELYSFWRKLENLPRFMSHLESVTTTDATHSHWKAKAPMGTSVEWDAEITSDVENERIGWRSVENSDVPNSGVVEFRPTANRGTEVRVVLTYEPPAGVLGSMVAKLFGEEPSQQVYGDLYRFKSLMESGEIITVDGQSSARASKSKGAGA